MKTHYPRIRVQTDDGYVVIRDGLTFRFYMHRPHKGFGPAVLRMLNVFMRALGTEKLTLSLNMEGDWYRFDEDAWERIQKEVLESEYPRVWLASESNGVSEFYFEYSGVSLEEDWLAEYPGRSCVATFQLTTEYMEQHGPGRVRELALALASCLPFTSGYASLSFNALVDLVGVQRKLRSLCFRYPGMAIIEDISWGNIGTRVPGAYWLTFLGPPVLGELGGVEGLRARLSSPGTTVQPLDGGRAVVTLGEWPQAGDLEAGADLPAYRELARVLEPWLYHDESTVYSQDFPPEDKRRWERRFLD
ncbi:DUF3396 domain-containing protein [Pyxidicoccus sp. 3LFB2]